MLGEPGKGGGEEEEEDVPSQKGKKQASVEQSEGLGHPLPEPD